MIVLTGADIRFMMRVHKKTIRALAAQMQLTMTHVREVRARGLTCRHAARDWWQAITGIDPGACFQGRQPHIR